MKSSSFPLALRHCWISCLLVAALALAHRSVAEAFSPNTKNSQFSKARKLPSTQLHAAAGAPNLLKPSSRKVQNAIASNNYLRGKLMLVTSKIFVSPLKYCDIFCGTLLPNTYWPEVLLIIAMVRSIDIAQFIYRKRKLGWRTSIQAEEIQPQQIEEIDASFARSKSIQIARVARQIGTLQAVLYVSDVALVILKLLGFKFVEQFQAQKVAGSIIFSVWFARTLSQLKFLCLQNPGQVLGLYARVGSMAKKRRPVVQAPTRATETGNATSTAQVGPPSTTTTIEAATTMGVYNRFANRVLDVILYFSVFINVVDLLGFHVGFALKSIFGLGSFGTLVLSLASKDVAAEFVGGLMVQSSNFLDEGEVVVLQDGTRGTITKIGWLFTYILRQDDKTDLEYIVRVPNSQISHQRIARVKRGRKSPRRLFY